VDKKIRRQLTLFVDKKHSQEIENIRRQFNPEQQKLIDSHVTLCRENEIENINAVLDNLQQLDARKIIIRFGQATKFDNGIGVLLPALGDNTQFDILRSKVLTGLVKTIQKPEPHITLMHPRNSSCTDEIFEAIKKSKLPTSLTFDTISIIEQIDGGQWQVLKSYKLNDD
jgi:2'-5' RNA ligase